MKKIILTFVFCIAAAGASFAQNNMQAMKFLTINALMDYGQKLYDRGDYHEACAVFKHVLTYDGNQAQALQYLKNMGDPSGVSVTPVLPLQAPKVEIQNPKPINIADTKELKKAIEDKKEVIKQLQDQIMRMRADIASQSLEDK